MLNENLQLELIINLNGKMIHKTPLLKDYDIQFVSDLTFCLKRETFGSNDRVFDEGDEGT